MFKKLMDRSLKQGSLFCFTHCYEPLNTEYITYQLLSSRGITILRNQRTSFDLKLRSKYFENFFKKWGHLISYSA